MCSDVETHIVHKHTNTTHTGPVHSTSWTMGAGLTAKSPWYPHYEESQPGHETWMTLFPKTRTHGHRRTQKYKYLGNECTTVSIKQPAHPHYELTGDTCMWPFPAGMWPLVWGWTMMGMSALIRQTSVVSQDGQVLQWVTLECVKVFPHPVIPSMTRCCECPRTCNLDYY